MSSSFRTSATTIKAPCVAERAKPTLCGGLCAASSVYVCVRVRLVLAYTCVCRRSKAGMQRAEEHATWHIKRRAIQGWCWCLYRRHQKHAWGRQIQRLAVRRQRAALSGTFHWWHVFTSYSRDRAAMIGVLRHQTDQASLRMCWRAWQGHVDRSRYVGKPTRPARTPSLAHSGIKTTLMRVLHCSGP